MAKGNIKVSTENIFPIIKKFLYSDHEIFLRELISNATDATLKLQHLSKMGKVKGDLGDLKIEIILDKENKQIKIIDKGIGMTADEVEKYINQVAFSGAEEFVNKYKDDVKDSGIIGHFGLGFYSSFMVSERVDILTKSFEKGSKAVKWSCDGSPQYTIEDCDKTTRGTEIILHIDGDSKEFLEESRINTLLSKYNKFMPIPIKFGTKQETKNTGKFEGEGDDKKEITEQIEVDNIVNNPNPAWIKKPSDLKDEDYDAFYKELYPSTFDSPMFNIHLNVDYPFNLTGILYFPKVTKNIDIQKDKIQLYQNQVFVTDNVEGIVPEFLQLLKGVIDSPDIPLNVSRSYLQADGAVKKISNYITRKVADKLNSIFKKDRKSFEQKWEDVKIIIEYGMLSDEKFFEKAQKFALFPTVDGEYFTFEELVESIKDNQTDKDGNTKILYCSDKKSQHSFIESAKSKSYKVLVLDSPIISHLIQKLESTKEKVQFVRVDSDFIENIIKKEDSTISKLSDEQKKELKELIEKNIPKEQYTVQVEDMNSDSLPFTITVPEFMRRMKEMSQTGGGMFGMGEMPEMYNLVVNSNNELITKILESKKESDKVSILKRAFDLARLSQNLLHGEELTNFIKENYDLLKK